jgi:hypothetical protein
LRVGEREGQPKQEQESKMADALHGLWMPQEQKGITNLGTRSSDRDRGSDGTGRVKKMTSYSEALCCWGLPGCCMRA